MKISKQDVIDRTKESLAEEMYFRLPYMGNDEFLQVASIVFGHYTDKVADLKRLLKEDDNV